MPCLSAHGLWSQSMVWTFQGKRKEPLKTALLKTWKAFRLILRFVQSPGICNLLRFLSDLHSSHFKEQWRWHFSQSSKVPALPQSCWEYLVGFYYHSFLLTFQANVFLLTWCFFFFSKFSLARFSFLMLFLAGLKKLYVFKCSGLVG